MLTRQDRPSEAIANLQEAWRLKPQSAEIGEDLRAALAASRTVWLMRWGSKAGGTPRLVTIARRLELQPNSVAALGNLGNALKQQAKLDEAAACYRRVLEIAPDSAQARNDLGLIAQAQGRTGRGGQRTIAVQLSFKAILPRRTAIWAPP